jgi:hypothetical protein
MKTMVECPGCGKLVEKDDGWLVLACADCIREWADVQLEQSGGRITISVGGAWPTVSTDSKSSD